MRIRERFGVLILVLGLVLAATIAPHWAQWSVWWVKVPKVGGLPLPVARVLAWVLLIGLLLLAVAIERRLRNRRWRASTLACSEIMLGPDDEAKPFELMSWLDAVHGALKTRYFAGFQGEQSFSFEILREDERRVRLLLVAPQKFLGTIQQYLRAKYTNIRFQEVELPPARDWRVRDQIVLARQWIHSTKTQKDYQNSVVETIVQAMDGAPSAAHLQILLTPLGAHLHKALQNAIRGKEQYTRGVQQQDPSDPGPASMVDAQIAKDAIQNVGKAAFAVEIRVAANDLKTVQDIFGAISEANGENRFRIASIKLPGAVRWWLRWFEMRQPSPVLFKRSPMFSFPLATIIHLPTARLRVSSLNRSLVRRGDAPLAVSRDPKLAIVMEDGGTRVGILEQDRPWNNLYMGTQGSGKTTDLLNTFKVDLLYRDEQGLAKAVVLIDIGKDTAKRALGMIPPEEHDRVVWFCPSDSDCPWTMNPLGLSGLPGKIAGDLTDMLVQAFGEEAIRANSRMFLENAFLSVLDVEGPRADLYKAYQVLIDEKYQREIQARVKDPHLKDFWSKLWTRMQVEDPRNLEQLLGPPRNKLDALLRSLVVRYGMTLAGERRLLDFNEIVRERKILICNFDKHVLGEDAARLFGIFAVQSLWHAAMGQNEIEDEKQRVPISLLIDEAQNFISPRFMNVLSEGRAFGLQTTLAVRFMQELQNEVVIQAVKQLMQNVILHQFEQVKEAEEWMTKYMRVFANMVTVDAESHDALNFGADDFMRLKKHQAICRFMVNGAPQQAFLAESIPWEESYHREWADFHLGVRPDAGDESLHDEDFVWDPGTLAGLSGVDGLAEEKPGSADGLPAMPVATEESNVSPEPAEELRPSATAGQPEVAPKAEEAVRLVQEVANRYKVKADTLGKIAREQGAANGDVIAIARWALRTEIQPKRTFYDSWRAAIRKRVAERTGQNRKTG